MMEKSTCSSEAAHVSLTQFAALEKVLTTRGGVSRLSLQDLLSGLIPGGYYLKMSPVCSVSPLARPSLHYYQFSAAGKLKFLFSDERKTETLSGDGKTQESSLPPPEDTAWHGELWTLNLSEWNQDFQGQSRSGGDVCSLSEVLIVGNVPRRYYLSRDASAGILNRAARRGKELPADLKSALLAVANQT